MKKLLINSENFDFYLKKILQFKKCKNIASGRIDIENIKPSEKVEMVIFLISSYKTAKALTYKILFWEEDKKIEDFFKFSFPNKRYKKTISYKNGKKAGVIYVEDIKIDFLFLEELLNNHFNFELAKEPSQNIRIQLIINFEYFNILFDIYDDRGLNIFHIPVSKKR
jgi:hypothetical protein